MQHNKAWATSAGNQAIELYHSDNAFQSNIHPIVMIGGTHGDEPEGVRLAQELLSYLKTHEVNQPWILIPCLNPDGFANNERTNANGVDLNRNYPASNWSPEFNKPRYYPGPHPASEPEIQALMKLIEQVKPRLLIHFHSIENPCVVCTGKPGLAAAKLISEASGYPVQDDIGYPTPGSLSEYGWKDLGIPVICVEEQEKIDLDTVWSRFKEGLLNILLAS